MFYVMETGLSPALDVYLEENFPGKHGLLPCSIISLPSYAAPTALARSCLMLLSGGAGTLTSLSLWGEGTMRENS